MTKKPFPYPESQLTSGDRMMELENHCDDKGDDVKVLNIKKSKYIVV